MNLQKAASCFSPSLAWVILTLGFISKHLQIASTLESQKSWLRENKVESKSGFISLLISLTGQILRLADFRWLPNLANHLDPSLSRGDVSSNLEPIRAHFSMLDNKFVWVGGFLVFLLPLTCYCCCARVCSFVKLGLASWPLLLMIISIDWWWCLEMGARVPAEFHLPIQNSILF